MANELSEPTDEELAKWHEDYFAYPLDDNSHRARRVESLRAAIRATDIYSAAGWLEQAGWSCKATEDIARALRRRFPQPITGAVLRAAGFERTGGEGTPYLLHAGRRLVIAQDMRDGVFELQWSIDNDCEVIRTPDRLHAVVRHLRGLYDPEGGDA